MPKQLRNMSLGLTKGQWWLHSWQCGLDWLKLGSSCLRTLTGTGSKQQQLDKEFWDACLLWGNWKRWRGFCLARLQCLISSSHHQGLVYHHLYCWLLLMMIQTISCSSGGSTSSFSVIYLILFCKFSWSCKLSFSLVKYIVWDQPPHFDTVFTGKSVLTYVASLRTTWRNFGDDLPNPGVLSYGYQQHYRTYTGKQQAVQPRTILYTCCLTFQQKLCGSFTYHQA